MTSNQPLVTVITITFNLVKNQREDHIRQSIESVRNQTYKNVEHLIIDGASKDGTLDLIEEYVKKGWVKCFSEPDKGIYDAMNKGIAHANGKYIAFLNSDDYYHSKYAIEESVKKLEETGADFSYAPAIFMTEDDKPLPYIHPHTSPKIYETFITMPFCHQTMFTKLSVLKAENGFDSNFRLAGDYDLVIRLALKKYSCTKVNKPFVTFRFGGASDAQQAKGLEEITTLYFNNYSKLAKVTREECEKIYCQHLYDLPVDLAKALKDYEPYFSYDRYNESLYLRIQEIYNSTGWKVLELIKKIIYFIIPLGSLRRKILFKILNKKEG